MSKTFFKAKKYVASKMSESATGRAVVTRYIGSAGDALFQSLRSATEHFAGPKRAKEMKVDIFKLVTKAALLFQNRVLTEEATAPARAPIASLVSLSIDVLERGGRSASDQVVEDLGLAMVAAHDVLLALLRPHIREHNWKRLTNTMTFFGDAAFLTEFLRNPEYQACWWRRLVVARRWRCVCVMWVWVRVSPVHARRNGRCRPARCPAAG